MKTTGSWIWCKQNSLRDYNQVVRFRYAFSAKAQTTDAWLRIAAAHRYRALLNGKWIQDGPPRFYPSAPVYDTHDIRSFLRPGRNHLDVWVRYYGTGTFQQAEGDAGLWAELVLGPDVLGSDATWMAEPDPRWLQHTPKISIQMEPFEEVNARVDHRFKGLPSIVSTAYARPLPARTHPLTRKIRRPKSLRHALVVKRDAPNHCVPVTRLAHPRVIEANYYTSRPVILSAILEVTKAQTCSFEHPDWIVAVNGVLSRSNLIKLTPGRYAVLFFCCSFYGHNKEIPFPYLTWPGATWQDWQVGIHEPSLFADNDRNWHWFPHPRADAVQKAYEQARPRIARKWNHPDSPRPSKVVWRKEPLSHLFLEDHAATFHMRQPVRMLTLKEQQIIKPHRAGDVELCYDLGVETVGYLDFRLHAPQGVILDIHLVEYITPDGKVQHPYPSNRNGLRYITKEGINRFTSLKRRAGRYIFITLRNQRKPVTLHSLRMIEATAPVQPLTPFRCSDSTLTRLWKVAERTLRLCMEDTFTDCPLYEQTLWIGDARNEALYAYLTYGDYRVAARSLELGAQSLEHLPLVGAQVPSAWDCLLPAWSFLWGVAVWEHYYYTGDRLFLRDTWPAVQSNLAAALQQINLEGLFQAPWWNLLEWADIDHAHPTVLHNSMLLVAALHAAETSAAVLQDAPSQKQYALQRKRLVRSLNRYWDNERKSYPDALLEEGRPCDRTCQHTSALALMCGIAHHAIQPAALENLRNPPAGMTTVGSPFATQFLYEAFEVVGDYASILKSMRRQFRPMLDAGCTTLWETFADSAYPVDGFPTRSHCHAWSASPLYFLPRIVLGITPTAPGGLAFKISPRLFDLRHAAGGVATPQGPLRVAWRLQHKTLQVDIQAPQSVEAVFSRNATHPEDIQITQTTYRKPGT